MASLTTGLGEINAGGRRQPINQPTSNGAGAKQNVQQVDGNGNDIPPLTAEEITAQVAQTDGFSQKQRDIPPPHKLS